MPFEVRERGGYFNAVRARRVGDECGEVDVEVGRVGCVRVGAEGRCAHRLESVSVDAGVLGRCWNGGGRVGEGAVFELARHSLVPLEQHVIHGEVSDERTPLSSHISNREAVVDGQTGDPIAREFDRGIEHLVLVKRAAQRDDHVLPGDASGQPAPELDLDHTGHLPPGGASGPYGRRVRSNDRRADTPNAAIHVAVAVGRDREGVWERITFFDEDLVADPTASGVKIDAM